MIDMMKRFFGKEKKGSPGDNKSSAHDLRVATCAVLLEMAGIDDEFSDIEKDHMLSILQKNHGLSDEHVHALVETAQKELDGSIDLWQFTNRINQNYSLEEKLGIIEMVWRIAYADGRLDKHEDYLAHKLATLLRLSHKQLIDAKMKVLYG